MVPPIDRDQASRFLQILGKDPTTARLRAFPHRLNPNRTAIGARKGAFNLSDAHRWQSEGRGVYLVINDGGDRADQITACRAFFCEWDNKPITWQLTAWRSLGFGKPTCIINTGGKSAHLYWVLQQPIPREQWEPIQAALLAFADADKACKDASRVMRLPGAHYMGPNGQPTGQTVIVEHSGITYTPEDVDAWILPDEFGDPLPLQQPAPIDPQASPPQPSTSSPQSDARPLEQIRDALAAIPQRYSGSYIDFRNILWGLIDACSKAGHDIETAIDLMEAHSPSATCGWDVRQVATSGNGSVKDATFWWHARQHGWRPPRRHSEPDDPFADWPDPDDTTGAQEPQEGAGSSSGKPPPGQAPTGPPVLTIGEVRERLRYAVEAGASRQDLEQLRIELAEASELNPASLRDLLISIQQEHEAAFSIAAESASLRAAADRRDVGQGITADFLLPNSVAHAVRTRTRSLPVDDVSAVMAVLVAVSGVVKLGSQVVVSQACDYRVPINLYAALVARSGAKKSPVSRILVSSLTTAIRTDLARDHTRALAAWHEENRGVKPADRSPEPQPVYISTADFTAEALAHQLQVQEGKGLGLLINRDELAGMFGQLNAYRKGRGGDEEQLLEAYDGSGFHSLRVSATGGGRFYERCHLSIWGTIQPPILRQLVANGDASGLWARFMFVPLPDRIVPIPAAESFVEQQAATAAEELLASIAAHVYTLPRTALELSPEAREAFVQYEKRCQHDVQSTLIPAQGALYGKAAGKALRIAGLLHLIHQAVADGEHSDRISEAMLRRATTLTDHINTWTLELHASVAENTGANELMRFIHKLASTASGPIQWRDIAQRLSKAQRRDVDSATAYAAMEALVVLGVGEVERGSRGALSYTALEALP